MTNGKPCLTFNNRTAYLPEWVEDVEGMADPILTEYTTAAMLIATMVLTKVAMKKIGRNKKTQQPLQ